MIQIFNVGAERMLGYTAADVVDKITPANISDPQEVIERAASLTNNLRERELLLARARDCGRKLGAG